MTALRTAALAAAVLVAPVAQAFEFQKTTTGEDLHFTAMPQYFYLSEDGTLDITGEGAFEAVRRGFDSWTDVEGSDARFARLEKTTLGLSDVFKDAGMPARDRQNLVVWVETNWIESPSQIAVTYTYFVDRSGKILEDDITMNGEDFSWTAGDAGTVLTDTESIAAHEIGHAFGLAHSLDSEATMFATAGVGETKKRSLAQDDMDAVIELYPPGCCNRHRGDDLMAVVGCNVAASNPGAAPGLAVCLMLVGGLVVIRRRRKGRVAFLAALIAIGVLGFAGNGIASVAVGLSVDDLTQQASTVVVGRVVGSQTLGSGETSIVTLTEIEVDDVLKGDAPAIVTVVEPGGVASDGIGMTVSGSARFAVGEEVVLFAEKPRGAYASQYPGTLRAVGMTQGKFRVVREAGAPARVTRDLSGVTRVVDSKSLKPIAVDELDGLALDDLAARVVSFGNAAP